MKTLQIVSLIIGAGLLALLIYRLGFRQILDSVRLVGAGFLVLLAVSGVRHLLRAAAWKKCFEIEHRRISLFELFNVRLAGEAVRYVSFTGPFLGEPMKAALIKKRLPLTRGLSAVIVENMTFMLAAILTTVSGLIVLLFAATLNNDVRLASIIVSAALVFFMLLMSRSIMRRRFIVTPTVEWLARLTNITALRNKIDKIKDIEISIYDFYNHRERTFLIVLLLELGAQVVNVFEVYLILYYMNVEAHLVIAFIIETAMKLINFAFFFVPGQVGVLEGGNALMLKTLGLGAATGVALALIEKVRTLAWAAYGLIALTVLLKINTRRKDFVVEEVGR